MENSLRLWLGGVPADAGIPDVFNLIKDQGKIEAIVIRPKYAFVELSSTKAGQDIVNAFQGIYFIGSAVLIRYQADVKKKISLNSLVGLFPVLRGKNTPLVIEEAKSSQSAPIMSQVSVFITDLHADTDISSLKNEVARVCTSEIENGTLHVSHTGNPCAIAEFVFSNESSAREAVSALKNFAMLTPGSQCFVGVRFQATRKRRSRPDNALPFPIQLFVRPSLVGAIIGKGGANIRELAQSSRAHIELERRDPRSANNGRRIVINGTLNNSVNAFRALVTLMAENDRELSEQAESEGQTSIQLVIPSDMVGHLIGRAGSTIKYIVTRTGTELEIIPEQYPAQFSQVRIIKLQGTPRQLTSAFEIMLDKFSNAVRRTAELIPGAPMMGMMQPPQVPGVIPFMSGYPSVMPAQPVEVITVHIPTWGVGAIIGRSGSNIRYMMQESGAQIRVNNVPEESEGSAETRECVVQGTAERQLRAHVLIFRRLQEEHRKINNGLELPDIFSASMTIPTRKVGRVIGRNGSNLRHIQETSNISIEIEQSPDLQSGEAVVHIRGQFHPVQSALNLLRPSRFRYTILPSTANSSSRPLINLTSYSSSYSSRFTLFAS
eukprot:gene10894-2969_t